MVYTIAANLKSIAMMRLKPYLLAFFVIASLLIVACGQTGDLYLPENEPQDETEAKKEKSKN